MYEPSRAARERFADGVASRGRAGNLMCGSRVASAMMFCLCDANREDREVTSSLSLMRKQKK